MHCVTIHQDRFITPSLARRYLDQCQEQEGQRLWAGSAFRRFIPDSDPCVVIEYYYQECPFEVLDSMFAAQMASKDKLFAMPGSGSVRKGLIAGSTAGMLDYDDEDGEEY